MLNVNPDLTKTTVLEEVREYANKARLSLINLYKETEKDLKRALDAYKIKIDLGDVLEELKIRLDARSERIDAIEEEFESYYHGDDLTEFVRKAQISKVFITDVVKAEVGDEKIL